MPSLRGTEVGSLFYASGSVPGNGSAVVWGSVGSVLLYLSVGYCLPLREAQAIALPSGHRGWVIVLCLRLGSW